MIYLLTIIFYANAIPFLFFFHSNDFYPIIIFLRAVYSILSPQVHFALTIVLSSYRIPV